MKNELRVLTLARAIEGDACVPKFEIVSVENHYKALQKLVGGNIEIPPITQELTNRRIDVIINENGKIDQLAPNIILAKDNSIVDTLNGDVVFVSANDEGEFESITDEQVDYIKEQLAYCCVLHDGRDCIACPILNV